MTYVYLVEAWEPYSETSIAAVFDTEEAAKKYAALKGRKGKYHRFLVQKFKVHKANTQSRGDANAKE